MKIMEKLTMKTLGMILVAFIVVATLVNIITGLTRTTNENVKKVEQTSISKLVHLGS